MAEFFVSYTKADQPWAEWIAYTLEANGHSCIIQTWDFRPGANFVLEMQKAAEKAEHTIAVLSPAYLRAIFPAPEWAAAFTDDPQGLRRKMVPVRVEFCEPEGLLKSIVHIDLAGLGEAAATAALLRGLEPGRVKPATVAFPGTSGAAPARPKFPGRETPERRRPRQMNTSPNDRWPKRRHPSVTPGDISSGAAAGGAAAGFQKYMGLESGHIISPRLGSSTRVATPPQTQRQRVDVPSVLGSLASLMVGFVVIVEAIAHWSFGTEAGWVAVVIPAALSVALTYLFRDSMWAERQDKAAT